jgi:hypothetical protein
MAIEWENGFVKRISLGGLTGAGWGISVQDLRSWFTLDGAVGCVITDRGCSALANGFRRCFELKMAEGHWMLTLEATSWRGPVTISHQLDSLAPSRLSSMAIDILFDQSSFERAVIGSEVMEYGDRGIWRHGLVPHVTLAGTRGTAWIRVSKGSARFAQRVGVRGEPEGWIVHTELRMNAGRDRGETREGQQAVSSLHNDETMADHTVPIEAGERLVLTAECELSTPKPEAPPVAQAVVQLA